MRKTRGFRIGRKVVKLWKWLLKAKTKTSAGGYLRLGPPDRKTRKPMTKICDWGRRLTHRLSRPLRQPQACGFAHVGQTPLDSLKPSRVPKGHLAVYVGQKDDGPQRFFVPVIYFNHPLFGDLLSKAEKEYGFHHPGGITIPCGISDFENVQMKIATGN